MACLMARVVLLLLIHFMLGGLIWLVDLVHKLYMYVCVFALPLSDGCHPLKKVKEGDDGKITSKYLTSPTDSPHILSSVCTLAFQKCKRSSKPFSEERAFVELLRNWGKRFWIGICSLERNQKKANIEHHHASMIDGGLIDSHYSLSKHQALFANNTTFGEINCVIKIYTFPKF